MTTLIFWDMAIFDNSYIDPDKKKFFQEKFISLLIKMGSKKNFEEKEKNKRDEYIINLVLEAVRESMIFYKSDKARKKKMEHISESSVLLVPENIKVPMDPIFGGIVVERHSSDAVFAIKAFQRIFLKACYWRIRVSNDHKIVLDPDLILKEGVASLVSRDFFEKSIKGNGLFEKIDVSQCFNLEAESAFNEALDNFWERSDKVLSRKELFPLIVGAIINGAYASYVGTK